MVMIASLIVTALAWAAAALLCAVLLAYAFAKRETLDVATIRKSCHTHQFVKLSKGTTAFLDEGPRQGPVIMIIHGLTVGSVARQLQWSQLKCSVAK